MSSSIGISSIFAFVIGLTLIFHLDSVRAEVPNQLEPEYAEAILAFNGKQYSHALKILNELLKSSPSTVEFLELKALGHKLAKEPKESAATYKKLLATKKKLNAPANELAPYQFELGMHEFGQNNFKTAIEYFKASIASDFNVAVSEFFSGLSYFQLKEWPDAAEHFKASIARHLDAIEAPAHFYLAQTYARTGFMPGSTQEFRRTQEEASKVMNDPNAAPESKKNAKEILEQATKALAPFDRNTWYANVTLNFGYDSNVLTLPDDSSSAASGADSFKPSLSASAGYVTSPLHTFQFIPSYRFSGNYNFNSATASGQYITNVLSLYANYKPLSLFAPGFKILGTHLFQKEEGGPYRSYSLTGTIGPYARMYFSEFVSGGAELVWEPQRYYQDGSATTSQRRTGDRIKLQVYTEFDKRRGYLNFTPSLGLSVNFTEGSDYDNKAVTFSITQVSYISEKLKVATTPSLGLTFYDQRSPDRFDKLFGIQSNATYALNSKISLLGEVLYNWNVSTVPSVYQYNRYSITIGASYNFL